MHTNSIFVSNLVFHFYSAELCSTGWLNFAQGKAGAGKNALKPKRASKKITALGQEVIETKSVEPAYA